MDIGMDLSAKIFSTPREIIENGSDNSRINSCALPVRRCRLKSYVPQGVFKVAVFLSGGRRRCWKSVAAVIFLSRILLSRIL